MTLVGPHREDITLLLGGMPVKHFASHGESWSFALALKLASWFVHVEDDSSVGSSPILILDDVFAELDSARATAWARWLPMRSRCSLPARC